MFTNILFGINFVAKRVVAYPLVIVALLLTFVAQWLIILGAWLTDNEGVIKFYDS